MILALKELVVLLGIALGVFTIVRPVARVYCPPEDFVRRCKVCLALIAATFISPNFWVFLLAATPLLIISGKRDSNAAAIYLFLIFLLPPVSVRVPMIGVSYLIDLNFHLLLSFCILAPAAWRLRKERNRRRVAGLRMLDNLLLAYCVLTAFLFVQPEIARGVLMEVTFTDCLRRLVTIFFSLFIPYFVISRTSISRAAIYDMVASFGIKCAFLAGVAIFEGARRWLLYGELFSRWGSVSGSYLARGGDIRAMASTGHPLTLGFLLAVAFGFWLYLQQGVRVAATRWIVTGLFLFGLMADYSRGPWLGAVLIYVAFAALAPRSLTKIVRAFAAMSLFVLVAAISPLGGKIASVVPFLGGTVDVGNVIYRERLFARSWEIIMEHPWLGDQQAVLKMEDLRQGEGIIDLINGFLEILLSDGFLGLSLFLLFIVISLIKTFGVSKAKAKSDADLSKLGACLIACMLGSLFMTWVGGLIELMSCVLVALMVAYIDLGRRPQTLTQHGSHEIVLRPNQGVGQR